MFCFLDDLAVSVIMALCDPAPDSFFVSVPQAEDQLRIVEEQRKIHEERMKLEQDRQKQQKEEQKIILGKGKSRPKLSFTLKATE